MTCSLPLSALRSQYSSVFVAFHAHLGSASAQALISASSGMPWFTWPLRKLLSAQPNLYPSAATKSCGTNADSYSSTYASMAILNLFSARRRLASMDAQRARASPGCPPLVRLSVCSSRSSMSRSTPPFSSMSRISSELAHACIAVRGPELEDTISHSMAPGPYMASTAWRPVPLSSRAAPASCSCLRCLKSASAVPTRTTWPKYGVRHSGCSGSACSSHAR